MSRGAVDAGMTAAEEYELTSPRFDNAESGPSQPFSPSNPRRPHRPSSKGRRLTLPSTHPKDVLFAAPPSFVSHKRHNSTLSNPNSPVEATPRHARKSFLSEDLFTGVADDEGEELHVPDFAEMLGFNPDQGEDHFAVAQGMKSRWKKRLYLLMEEPSSGREAFFVHVGTTGAILFSAILTILSTLPSFHIDTVAIRILFGLDTTIVVLFTIEYITRSLAHADTWTMYYSWVTSFFAVLDLIAILPFYVEIARSDDYTTLFRFSILRTFRLLRVFRAFRYQNQLLLTIEVFYLSVRRSRHALLALSFFILLVLVLFSTLIFFAERGTWDEALGSFVDFEGNPSLFSSIPQTAWFALVTMSTVGYGDLVPRSNLGKLLTVPLLMFGLLLIALPSFVLGRNFAIVFDAMTREAQQAPSVIGSDQGESPHSSPVIRPTPQAIIDSTSSAPLLPPGADAPTHTANLKRGASPFPPRMWDGGEAMAVSGSTKGSDLTNTKLAKNQLVLLEQIDELKRTVDRQGEMMARLLMLHEGRNAGHRTNEHLPGLDHQDTVSEETRTQPRQGDRRVEILRQSETDGAEEQFALGSDEEEGEVR